MAHSYDNHDYWRTDGRTIPTTEYNSSGRTLGPYPTATKTDAWVGDTWRNTDHDATYGRSTLSSYPHATQTGPPRGYSVSGDNWYNKQPGTTGRTYDRRGSFDEYVMKVATNYITPSGPVSNSTYVRSQNPNEYNDYYKKDFYKANGYHPRGEHGSNNLRPGYNTSNEYMVRSSGQYGAPMSDPTNNIGLALDHLKKEATAGSTAPSSQYGVHRTTHDVVDMVETVVDPSRRYGKTTYFRRR